MGRKEVKGEHFRKEDLTDPLALYLKEASEAPILEPQEEQNLFSQKIKGEKAREELISQNGDLAEEEKKRFQRQIEEGDEAKRKIIRSNLRLVISIARRYRDRGVPFLDLIQEGNIGLIKAIDRFDIKRINRETGEPFKFSTYGTWWVRQAISRAVAYQGRTIRLPVHRIELLTQIGKAKRNLSLRLERKPTIDEIASELGKKSELIEETLRQAIPPFSLDKESKKKGERTIIELIEDKDVSMPLEESGLRLLGTEIRKQLETLTDREKKVLEMRFGLKDGGEQTLEKVGEEFGLSRERIRQIERDALKKLRHPLRARKLKDYLE